MTDDNWDQRIKFTGAADRYPHEVIGALIVAAGAHPAQTDWLTTAIRRWAATWIEPLLEGPATAKQQVGQLRRVVKASETLRENVEKLSDDARACMWRAAKAEDALDGVRGVEALLARLLSAVTSVEAIAERAAEDATPRPGPQAKAIRIEARRGAVSELGPMFLALTGKRPTVRTSQAMGHPVYGPWYDFTVTALEPLFGPNEAKAGLIHTLRKVARGMKDEPDAWHVHYLPDNSPE